MRLLLPFVAACGFSVSADGPAGTRAETIVDDALEDGTVIDGVVVNGTVEPDGFVLGGLRARGYDSVLIQSGEDFEKVLDDADAATQTGMAYAQVPTDWVQGRPRGLGFPDDNQFTVIYDGEILLPKGMVTLEINPDDRALVEVLGSVIAAYGPGVQTTTFDVPAAGWYPIRAAISEDGGNARLPITIVQGQVRTVVNGDRLRARVTDHRGVRVFAFDGQGFVGEVGQAARPTIDDTFGVLAPGYDLTASIDRFSLRFAGQLRIDTAGTYTFAGTHGTDDGFRLWIDGELVAHVWLGHPSVPSADVMLDAGWHTILVDYADEIGAAEIHLTMNGAPIPSEQLRPVVEHGHTFTVATTTPTPIADGGTTLVQLPLPGDNTTLIDSIDVGYRIDNQDMSTITVTLFDCDSRPLAVNNAPSYHYYPADRSCAGTTTNPAIDWAIRIVDGTIGTGPFVGLGQIRDYGVSALYRGGPKLPWAPITSYVSKPHATPGAITIESVRAMGELGRTAVEVAVRTGADVASLEAAPFELVRDGVTLPGNELTQYRVTMTTDGWQHPILDKVEIVYVVADSGP